jgi:hypothetical protein
MTVRVKLANWDQSSKRAEEMCAEVLRRHGLANVQLASAMSGPEAGRGLVFGDDKRGAATCYFPNEPQPYRKIRERFVNDFRAALRYRPESFYFLTGQTLMPARRAELLRQAAREAEALGLAPDVQLFHNKRLAESDALVASYLETRTRGTTRGARQLDIQRLRSAFHLSMFDRHPWAIRGAPTSVRWEFLFNDAFDEWMAAEPFTFDDWHLQEPFDAWVRCWAAARETALRAMVMVDHGVWRADPARSPAEITQAQRELGMAIAAYREASKELTRYVRDEYREALHRRGIYSSFDDPWLERQGG